MGSKLLVLGSLCVRAAPVVIVLGLLSAAGCASSREGAFPTAEQLSKLATTPAPHQLFPEEVKDVPEWTLTGPLPDKAGVAEAHAEGAWGTAAAAAAAARPGMVVVSTDMACVAREVGLFYLETGAQPNQSLQRFMLGRCGSSAANLAVGFLRGDAPDDVPDEAVFAKWGDQFRKMVEGQTANGQKLVGVWFGRKNGRAVAISAAGPRLAHLESMSTEMAPDGKVILRGELLMQAATVRVVANRGRFGVYECMLDKSVVLPRFAIECSMSPEDESAWIELDAIPPGRILGKVAAMVLMRRPGGVADKFVRATYIDPHPIGEAGVTAPDVVAAVNEARAKAGLGPLQLEERESETARKVAPHYFAAVVGVEEEMVADTVALGLLAGWDVAGLVSLGWFAPAWLTNSRDLGDLVSVALEFPSTRDVLMNPTVSRLAVGTIWDANRVILAAVLSTYAMFDASRNTADAAAVLQRFDETRKSTGLPRVPTVAELEPILEDSIRAIEAGTADPAEALDAALYKTASVARRGARGWVVEAAKLEELQLPPEVVKQPEIGIGMAVGRYRPKKEPWGRYLLLIISVDARDLGGTKI
jgi:hypothetical protein